MTPGMEGRHHRAWGLTRTHGRAYALIAADARTATEPHRQRPITTRR